MEKEIGWWSVVDSEKGKATCQPALELRESILLLLLSLLRKSERILEHCYQVGKEYDHYFVNEKFAAITNIGVSMVNAAQKTWKKKTDYLIARGWIKRKFLYLNFPGFDSTDEPWQTVH